jgi:RecB family endonuclease NucS
MNYWLTTHWPPYEDEPADSVAAGVWLAEGRQSAGASMGQGDLVFIYQPRTGRTLIETQADGSTRNRACQVGREGIVALGRVEAPISAQADAVPERYTDGTETWWRWYAPIKLLNRSGFVSRAVFLPILGYSTNYNLRGLGEAHSGLKKLDQRQFEELVRMYRSTVPVESRDARSGHQGGTGESQPHLDLKEYVAAHPSVVLNEPDVRLLDVERAFPTGDRADVVLQDRIGRIIGLEVEIIVPSGDLTGALQAIKYRRMLEMATGIRHGDGRAVLVAYEIAADVQRLCRDYEVECFEVSRAAVAAWRQSAPETRQQGNASDASAIACSTSMDADVLALAHHVPQPTASPSTIRPPG